MRFFFYQQPPKRRIKLNQDFSDHGKTGWILSLRDNYLRNGDVNVLSIEWHIMAITPWYTTAAKLTRYINQLNGPENSLIYLS